MATCIGFQVYKLNLFMAMYLNVHTKGFMYLNISTLKTFMACNSAY